MPRHVRGFFLPTERSLLLTYLSVNRKFRKVVTSCPKTTR
jgi:hypothetical protein